MFKIIHKQTLAPDIKRLDIFARDIAGRLRPGQFVMVTPTETTPSLALTVVDCDPAKETISLIFQEMGFSTRALGTLKINQGVFNILGPLGIPSVIARVGTVACVAAGIGTTQILPICRAHKKAGNKVIGIIGAKTQKLLMLETQMRLSCHKLFIATNDGSYLKRGLATDLFRELLQMEKLDLVYAVGSVDLMQAVVAMTQDKQIPTRVSLQPVVRDGVGICGSCRVKVDGRIILSCVDGPEFDGHQVDFTDLKIRMESVLPRRGLEQDRSLEGLSERSRKSQAAFSPKSVSETRKRGSGIFTKFLSEFLKTKP